VSPRELLFSLSPSHPTIRRDTFRSGGKGGQNQNKIESGVRFTHLPTGAACESRDQRSQKANERSAWRKLCADPRVRFWLHEEAKRLDGEQTAEQRVAAMLADPHQTIVEVRRGGEWVRE